MSKEIRPHDLVTVTKTKHIVEVQHMEKRNGKSRIRKLNKDEYMNLNTGEVKDFDHTENRSENINSIRKTMKNLRYLINNNFEGKKNELHIILTYKENMTDNKQLYKDCDRFMKKLKYRQKTTIEYINVVEAQGRGAWHCHLLAVFPQQKEVFIRNSDLADMWGHGFVRLNRLEDVDNIGAYLSAYLADIELKEGMDPPAGEVLEKEVNGKKKRFIKGGRLHLYKTGMKLYRKSRGILPPDREQMTYKKSKKITGSANPHYRKTFEIESEDFTNTITFEQYNLKRQINE